MSTSQPFKDLALTNLSVVNGISANRITASRATLGNLDVVGNAIFSGPIVSTDTLYSGVPVITNYIVNPNLIEQIGEPIAGVFETIQSAHDAAVADGVSYDNPKIILITPGIYNENLNITARGLTIRNLSNAFSFTFGDMTSTVQINGNIVINSDGPLELIGLTLVGAHTLNSTGTFAIGDNQSLQPILIQNCTIRNSNDFIGGSLSMPPACMTLTGTCIVYMNQTVIQGSAAVAGVFLNDNSNLRVTNSSAVAYCTLNDNSIFNCLHSNFFGQLTMNGTQDVTFAHSNINHSNGAEVIFSIPASRTVSLYNCNVLKTNGGNWASGMGTVQYSNTGFRFGSGTSVAPTVTITEGNGSTVAPSRTIAYGSGGSFTVPVGTEFVNVNVAGVNLDISTLEGEGTQVRIRTPTGSTVNINTSDNLNISNWPDGGGGGPPYIGTAGEIVYTLVYAGSVWWVSSRQ